MNVPSTGRRALVIALATALFLVSGTLAWAAAVDYGEYEVAPQGTSVGGHDISGLTRDQARAVIESKIAEPVLQPVTVRFLTSGYTIPAAGFVSVDVETMLARAFAVRDQATIDERVLDAVSGSIPATDIAPMYSVSTDGLALWASDFARLVVDRAPVSASVRLVQNRPKLTRAQLGYRTNQAATVQAVSAAMLSSNRTVNAPVAVLKPKIPDSKFARVIVVDKSERRLYFYRDQRLVKKFRVAVGTNRYPTPAGNFKIVQKRYRPSWSNPGSAWAASMPAYIPPGPGNPLGTRALNLNAPGIRIHGTNKISSIGTAASHGCIRMLRKDVEWLYDRVTVGTPVYVVR